jgi:hypothetical protein
MKLLNKTQKLTKEQIKNYLKSPNHCPYCNSKNIEADEINYDDTINCDVYCTNCQRTWNEQYEVTNITEL